MSVLKKLNIVLGADTTDLETKMRKAANNLRREGRNFGQIGTELSLAVSLPLLGIGASAIRAAGDMEAFKMGFNTTMKSAGRSAQDAAKEMEALREIAKLPGIDFEQAIKGSMRLQAVGMSAEKARKIMEELANGISMAGGSAQEFDSVTRQLSQMAGKGKVMQQDLNIMLENMPMLAKVLKDTFGATTADGLRDMGVNAEQFIDGITNGLSKLERVPGGLANSMVNFGVEVKMSLATVGEAINKAFNVTGKLEDFAGWIGRAATSFANLSEGTQKAIITTLGITAAIGPAVKAFSIYNNTKAAAIDLASKTVGAFRSVAVGVTAAAEAYRTFSVAQKLVVGGFAGLIGLGIIGLISQLSEKSDELAKSQQMVSQAVSDAAVKIEQEKMASDRLFSKLSDLTKGYTERKSALDELQKIYPNLLGNLSVEESSLEDIATAQRKVNDELVRTIALQQKNATANEIAGEIAKRRVRITQISQGAELTFAEASKVNTAEMIRFGGVSEGVINELQQEISGFESSLKQLDEQFYETFNLDKKLKGSGRGQSPFFGKKRKVKEDNIEPKKPFAIAASTKSTKEEKDAMAELAKAYAQADLQLKVYGDTAAATSEKKRALTEAINTLLADGIAPESEQVEMLRLRLLGLDAQLLATTSAQLLATEPILAVSEALGGQMEQVTASQIAWENFGNTISAVTAAAGNAMLEAAAAGETSFAKLGNAALAGAAKVVRAKLMEYVSGVIAKAGLTGIGALAAPALGALAGVAFNKVISNLKIPQMAEGGLVTRPTLALIGEAGPEMVVPPKKLPGMAAMMGMTNKSSGGGFVAEMKVKRGDLYVMVKEAALDEQRRTGKSFFG